MTMRWALGIFVGFVVVGLAYFLVIALLHR